MFRVNFCIYLVTMSPVTFVIPALIYHSIPHAMIPQCGRMLLVRVETDFVIVCTAGEVDRSHSHRVTDAEDEERFFAFDRTLNFFD